MTKSETLSSPRSIAAPPERAAAEIRAGGLLISFEGTDGAGKSTTARALEGRLKEMKVSCIRVDKWFAQVGLNEDLAKHVETLNSLIFGRPRSVASNLSDEYWFHALASWHRLVDDLIVQPALQRGDVVILDNSYHKVVARYLVAASLPENIVLGSFEKLSEPTLTVLLDVPPEIALERKGGFTPVESGRNGDKPSDFVGFQSQVSAQLRLFAGARKWLQFDTSLLGTEEIVTMILENSQVKNIIGSRRG
ncbi:thymidylate kinase [Arthrobacter sp. GAS37]|uniref:dTMP kinase n=1 Tax=Arthrobacter sp. GAS37 TaxID=3156261 RepID=UPI00383345EF